MQYLYANCYLVFSPQKFFQDNRPIVLLVLGTVDQRYFAFASLAPVRRAGRDFSQARRSNAS